MSYPLRKSEVALLDLCEFPIPIKIDDSILQRFSLGRTRRMWKRETEI